MNLEKLVSEALSLPPNAIAYQVSQQLANFFPGKAILEGGSYLFDIEDYAGAGLCTLTPKGLVHNQFSSYWDSVADAVKASADNVWYGVKWQNYNFDLLLMEWEDNTRFWIIADIREIAESFFTAVCEWNNEIRGEVLVFEGGYWHKDEDLFKAIKSATFDNLVLQGNLAEELRADANRFFASKAIYDRYNIPWKRGILLVGPPGNGKTHALKALINKLGKPCLYVKSFKSGNRTDEDNIHNIYSRARKIAPCVVVLEDLDSQVTPQNRSFLLNELDGFASNSGILTIATTNYPEKLDPAIVNRPSRFDRKYHFNLPELAERAAFIQLWNKALEAELKLSDADVAKVAELTGDFSFAYLKELFVSSMMGWIVEPARASLGQVMAEQAVLLRSQMATTNTTPAAE